MALTTLVIPSPSPLFLIPVSLVLIFVVSQLILLPRKSIYRRTLKTRTCLLLDMEKRVLTVHVDLDTRNKVRDSVFPMSSQSTTSSMGSSQSFLTPPASQEIGSWCTTPPPSIVPSTTDTKDGESVSRTLGSIATSEHLPCGGKEEQTVVPFRPDTAGGSISAALIVGPTQVILGSGGISSQKGNVSEIRGPFTLSRPPGESAENVGTIPSVLPRPLGQPEWVSSNSFIICRFDRTLRLFGSDLIAR